MRKHFLILMLLALLPLAGFAEDLREGKMVIPSTYYGYSPSSATIKVYNKANTELTLGTDFTFDGFFSDEACNNPLTSDQVKTKDASTVIWVKVTGKVHYENSLRASFEIKKMPLIVEGKFFENKDAKVYSAAEPTGNLLDVIAVREKVENIDRTDDFEDKITFARESGAVLDPVGFYYLIGTVTDNTLAKNYTIESEDVFELVDNDANPATPDVPVLAMFEITKKPFTIGNDGNLTISVTANLTYNGQAQKATVVVTDKVLGALTEATYYTAAEAAAHNAELGLPVAEDGDVPANFAKVLGYTAAGATLTADEATAYNNALQVAADDPKDGDYRLVWANNTNAKLKTAGDAPQVTIRGIGNYQEGEVAAEKFTIKQATLIVTPSAEKVYDGHDNIPTLPTNASTKSGQTIKNDNVTFTFQGFVGNETATIITVNTTDALEVHVKEAPALVWKKNSDKTPHVGQDYAIKFSNEDINKCFTTTNNNYFFYANEGTFDIKPKALTKVEVDDKTLKHGDPEVYTVTTTGQVHEGAGDNKVNDDQAVLDAIKVVREIPEGDVAYDFDLNAVFMTAEEIAEKTYDANKTKNAARIAAAQNAIIDYTFAPEVVTKGELTLENANLTIALNESKFTLTKVYDGQDINVTTDIKNKANLIIIGLKDQQESVDLSNLTLTVTPNAKGNIKDAGTYQLVLDGASLEGYDITFVPSQYKITKRPINVTLFDQTFVFNTVPNINQSAYEITNTDEDEGLAEGDKATEIFNVALTAEITLTEGKITAPAANADPVLNAITVVPVAGPTSKWNNYEFDDNENELDGLGNITMGSALIVAATSVVLDDTKDIADQLNTLTAAADVEHATVTFSPRNLNTEKWNVLVLPFDVTVKELSTAFGYAVVDVLDEANSNGNMSFKLKVSGKIDANTPFMIYPSDEKQNLNQVVFTERTIKKQTYTDTVEKEDGAHNKFVGTYKTTGIYGDKFYYMSAGEWKRAGNFTEAAPAPIKPLRAYIDLSQSTAAAPIITIEEPDGNTTAIKVLDVETMETYSVDGWYTLNGVKLQGMPTEKGIYINNGKKVVVK